MKKFLLGLFISLSLVSSCFAGPQWQKYSYFQNWGGLNDNLQATEIDDKEATDIQNIIFDTGGALKKRQGYLTVGPSLTITGTTGTAVTGLAFYQKNDGSRYLVAIGNTSGAAVGYSKTYAVGGGLPVGSWSNIDGGSALPATGYSTDNLVSFTVGENTLIFAFKTSTGQKPFKWIGSGNIATLTADADCPKASIVVFHKNHLFTNDTDNPSRIHFNDPFSGSLDITNWIATDFIDVENQDGTNVRAMISAYDSLYIFKDNSIWRVTGNDRDTWQLQKMVDNVGTLSQQSVCIVNNTIYFVTSQGDIAAYDGNYSVVFISQKIRNTIGGLNFSRATNALGIGFSTYKYKNLDFYCSDSKASSGTNNQVLLYDTTYNAWTKFSGINANAWCIGQDSVGQNILIFGDYSGYVHTYPSGSYYDGNVNTSAIVSFYQTKWFRYPEMIGDKYWRVLKTYMLSDSNTNSILTIDCRSDYEQSGKTITVDFSQPSSLWDVAQWDVDQWSGQSLIVQRDEIDEGTSMFQLKFYNSDVNRGFTLFGWENYIEQADRY